MTAPISVVEPEAPIRVRAIEVFTREFGAPASAAGRHRWVVEPGIPRQPVHVIINAAMAAHEAHVLVFDPSAPSGGQFLEMEIAAIEQVMWLVDHIRRSGTPRLGHQLSHTEQPPAIVRSF